MSLFIFFVLAVIVVGAIAYPLLVGRSTARMEPVVTDGEIERSVRALRRARSRDGLVCPACSQAYRIGDRYCVRCGGSLPEAQTASEGQACPSCGATIRESDRFCAKCGHSIAAEEVA